MYANLDKAKKTRWTAGNSKVHLDVGITDLVNLITRLYVMLLFSEVTSVSSSR